MLNISDRLVSEWHPTRNVGLEIKNFSAGSKQKVWWLGACGHEWDALISSRSNGSGCPVCSGKRIIVGVNDLTTTHPHLCSEWHPTRNNSLLPSQFSKGSKRKVWWLGDCGHEWESNILNRARNNTSGCPICSGKKTIPGVNDLFTLRPDLVTQLKENGNHNVDVSKLSLSSKEKLWWVCDKGHEWETQVAVRVRNGGCPYCSGRKSVINVTDLATTHPHLLKEWNYSKNVNVSPNNISVGCNKKVWWLCGKGHEWLASPNDRKTGTNCPICANKKVFVGFNDLITTHPSLANQWHPTRNGKLLSTMVTYGHDKKVWWLCGKGHEWESPVYSRASGVNCAKCSHREVDPGVTDLLTLFPHIAEQLHPTKNSVFDAQNIAPFSGNKMWWVCDKGHEWESSVSNRSAGKGCLKCSSMSQRSNKEKELHDFVVSLNVEVVSSDRTVLGNGQELDLFFPDKKIGVEFNGLYWHDENHKGRTYHYDKYVAAKNVGVQLIQIWEDDWMMRKNIIMKALAYKLGVSDIPKIFARKTSVVMLNTGEAQLFLENNHVQGFASGSYYVGLKNSDDDVVAVIVLKKEPKNVLNIVRYSTSMSVVGGFSKLLKFAEKTFVPTSFITFADHTISDGGLYENNGFVVDKILAPDYMYVVNKERKHKFGYRLKRFRNDPNLVWDENLTEKQLAELNNIPRIWDAGKTRYRYVCVS